MATADSCTNVVSPSSIDRQFYRLWIGLKRFERPAPHEKNRAPLNPSISLWHMGLVSRCCFFMLRFSTYQLEPESVMLVRYRGCIHQLPCGDRLVFSCVVKIHPLTSCRATPGGVLMGKPHIVRKPSFLFVGVLPLCRISGRPDA